MERGLRRERVFVRQQHQYHRGRDAPDRAAVRADTDDQHLCRYARPAQKGQGEPARRGRSGRVDRGHQYQGAGTAVRGPDQDQTRQQPSQGIRRIPLERQAGQLFRRASGRGQEDRPEKRRSVARPRGRPQGPRTHAAQERARLRHAAGQIGRLSGARPREERVVPGRGRLRGRFGQAGPRPPYAGDSPAARQDSERREGPLRQDVVVAGNPPAPVGLGGQRRQGRRQRPVQAALSQDHHHDGRGRGRIAHPYLAADVPVPPASGHHRERLSVHRPTPALQGPQGQERRLSERRCGVERLSGRTRYPTRAGRCPGR